MSDNNKKNTELRDESKRPDNRDRKDYEDRDRRNYDDRDRRDRDRRDDYDDYDEMDDRRRSYELKKREKINQRKEEKGQKLTTLFTIPIAILFVAVLLLFIYFFLFRPIFTDDQSTPMDSVMQFITNKTSDNPVKTDEEGNRIYDDKDIILTRYEEKEPVAVNSDLYSDPGKYALTTDYKYIDADSDYFDDALMIGDSRIEGFRLYGDLEGPTYYAQTGISLSQLLYLPEIATLPNGQKTDLRNALKQVKFKKIYIMIGVNNIGAYTTMDFREEFEDLIEIIHSYQPDAVIFIMSIMHISSSYESGALNNININDKNVAISSLANGIDTFYFNVNSLVTNDNGPLLPQYTEDGLHLDGKSYKLFCDFLRSHALPDEHFERLEQTW